MNDTGMPDCWAVRPIEELLIPLDNGKILNHGWSPQCDAHPAPPGGWGVLKTTAIQPGRFEPTHNKNLPAALTPRPGLEVKVGDMLLTCAGPRSRCGIPALVRTTPERLILSGKMYRFRGNPECISARYLEYYLLSAQGQTQIDGMKTGISDSGLNLTHSRFLKLEVPVAPLAEQERIADEVERRFSHVDAAERSIEHAQHKLKLARAAIEEEMLWAHGVPTVRLRDVLQPGGLANGKSVPDREGGFPVLRLTCMKGGTVDLRERKSGAWTRADAANFLVVAGDFFVVRGNGSISLVGRGARVIDEPDEVAYPDTLIRVRVDQSKMRPDFLALIWNSRRVRQQIEAVAHTTAGIYKVNQKQLAGIELPCPELDAQETLAQEVSRRLSHLDAADRALQSQARRCAAARTAILTAAFTGQLVPQDPSDESAAALLERIKEQCAVGAPPKTTTRRARAKKETTQ